MRKDAVQLSSESASGIDVSGVDLQKPSQAEVEERYERPKAKLSNFIVSRLSTGEDLLLTSTAHPQVWRQNRYHNDVDMYRQCDRCRYSYANDVLHLWERRGRLHRILYA